MNVSAKLQREHKKNKTRQKRQKERKENTNDRISVMTGRTKAQGTHKPHFKQIQIYGAHTSALKTQNGALVRDKGGFGTAPAAIASYAPAAPDFSHYPALAHKRAKHQHHHALKYLVISRIVLWLIRTWEERERDRVPTTGGYSEGLGAF